MKPQKIKINQLCKTTVSLACLALLFLVSSASAQVLLTDNWLSGGPNSENPNQNIAARQTGTQALDPYTAYGGQTQIGNTGTDVGTNPAVAAGNYLLLAFDSAVQNGLDVASASTGPLVIDFDMLFHNGSNPGGDGNSSDWGSFTLQGNAYPFPVVGGVGEFGFLNRLNGGIQVFQNGGSLSSVSSWDTPGFALQDHWKLIFTDTAGTGSAFVGNGSQVTMINGGTVSGGGTTLGTITLSQLNANDLYPGFRQTAGMFIGICNVSIQVTNPTVTQNLSFEQNVAPPGSSASVVPAGWLAFNKAGGGDIGSGNAGGTDYTVYDPLSPPAQGNQYAFVNNFVVGGTNGIYQDLGAMIPNHTYTLTVAIGSRADRVNSPGNISLVNGTDYTGTVLATTNGIPATQNTWQDYTVTYTTGPTVSGDLTVVLSVIGDGNIQADFDNVRLDNTFQPPPPPIRTQNTLPIFAETVVGDQVVFSAAYSNSPLANLQWQQIVSGPATNNINTGVVNVTNNGVVSTTLTLNNVQLTDSGSYQVQAVNATNSAAVVYSFAAPLVVGNIPAPVNNVIVNYAGQLFPSSSPGFFPAWPINTSSDLIFGFQNGSGEGTFTPGAGDFTGGGNYCNADSTVLSDGIAASLSSLPNLAFCACGPINNGVGSSMTYVLVTNSTPYGFDLTNITVFGGWQDGGRNEQKYQVLYSTMQSPGTFVPLVTADYLPTDTTADPSVTRTTLVPASGVMAHNVAAVEINFNVSPVPENGWEGYSEILVGGQASTGFAPALTNDIAPSAASDVVGGQIILTAGFSGATTLQWKQNGTNVMGANSSTLTLNNLQLASAGAYTLVASNAVGGTSSSACQVTVNTNSVPANNILTTIATQTSVASVFTPTWDPSQLSSSLIYNTPPSSSGDGDFTGGTFGNGLPTAGSLPAILTDGTFGTIDFTLSGTHAWVTCIGGSAGNNTDGSLRGGQYVTYMLPVSAHGYNISNIVTSGGWNDGGRDEQEYNINYATAANPTDFKLLTAVDYNPANPVGYSMVRATLTPVSGVLASNVVALQFDMSSPNGAGENGYSGYSQVAVYGSPSANAEPVGPTITIQHEETNFDYVLETHNLIANQLPSSYAPAGLASPNGEGCTTAGFTDGILSIGGNANSGMGGVDTNNSYSYIVFSATNSTSWNLTNIVTYSLWHDYGRDGQFYNLSYSTVAAPTTWIPLASVAYNPSVPHDGRASCNRVQIAPPAGQAMLAANVAAVKFDYTPLGNQEYGWCGVAEIVLQGTNQPAAVVPVLPTMSHPRVSGGNLILTGTGGTPAGYSYTWLTTSSLTPPVIWTTNTSGTLDGTGSFSNSIPIGTGQHFFRFRMP